MLIFALYRFLWNFNFGILRRFFLHSLISFRFFISNIFKLFINEVNLHLFMKFNSWFHLYSIFFWKFILFLFNIFYFLPFDFVVQHPNVWQNYSIAKLFRDFIHNSFTGNDSRNSHFHCNIETDNINPTSFTRNTTKHHIQNQDRFDEENDS